MIVSAVADGGRRRPRSRPAGPAPHPALDRSPAARSAGSGRWYPAGSRCASRCRCSSRRCCSTTSPRSSPRTSSSYPLRDLGGGAALAQTVAIPVDAQLPYLAPGGRLHAGVLVLLVLPLVAWWLQRRTVIGYEMRMTGHNPLVRGLRRRGRTAHGPARRCSSAARSAGSPGRSSCWASTTATSTPRSPGPGYAWTGFTAALLAVADPIGSLFAGAVPRGARGGRGRHGAEHRDPAPDRGHRPGRDHPHDRRSGSRSAAGSAGGWGPSDERPRRRLRRRPAGLDGAARLADPARGARRPDHRAGGHLQRRARGAHARRGVRGGRRRPPGPVDPAIGVRRGRRRGDRSSRSCSRSSSSTCAATPSWRVSPSTSSRSARRRS